MVESRKTTFPPIGVSALMVIFSVLCLTVFALLAVSTVRADQRLSEKSAQAVTGYYQADCEAEEILARLRTGERPANVKETNGIFTYTCPISETQTLVVEVTVDGTDYNILRWQAVSTADWQTSDQLPVWQGN